MPEIDGVRILTNDTCDFMHRVPCKFTLLCVLHVHLLVYILHGFTMVVCDNVYAYCVYVCGVCVRTRACVFVCVRAYVCSRVVISSS